MKLSDEFMVQPTTANDFWAYLCGLMHTYTREITQVLTGQQAARVFKM